MSAGTGRVYLSTGEASGETHAAHVATALRAQSPGVVIEGTGGSRLAAAGMPVPAAVHLTTAAYRRFVDANDLQSRILELAGAATLYLIVLLLFGAFSG